MPLVTANRICVKMFSANHCAYLCLLLTINNANMPQSLFHLNGLIMIDAVWAWAVLGVILLSVEMAIGSFDILWFGIAAICVAIALWLFPEMPSAAQYMMFAALSLVSLGVWRFHYKKTDANSRVGQAQGEEIGRIGIVTAACGPNQNGKIRFTQGLMGAREWTAVSHEAITENTEAKVIAVEGNALRIKPI